MKGIAGFGGNPVESIQTSRNSHAVSVPLPFLTPQAIQLHALNNCQLRTLGLQLKSTTASRIGRSEGIYLLSFLSL